jgi:hypothetical protein
MAFSVDYGQLSHTPVNAGAITFYWVPLVAFNTIGTNAFAAKQGLGEVQSNAAAWAFLFIDTVVYLLLALWLN